MIDVFDVYRIQAAFEAVRSKGVLVSSGHYDEIADSAVVLGTLSGDHVTCRIEFSFAPERVTIEADHPVAQKANVTELLERALIQTGAALHEARMGRPAAIVYWKLAPSDAKIRKALAVLERQTRLQ